MKYCFDTSAFIQPWQNRFPPDLFSPLWTKIERVILAGDIVSSKVVLDDLKRIDDDVYRWAKVQKNLFIEIDESIQCEVQEILAAFPRLVEQGGRRSSSDPFVVALAKLNNVCVVTYELPHPNSKRTNIPIVCRNYGIEYKDLLGVMRDYKWRFDIIE